MMSETLSNFPLSPASRMTVGLQILKCVLIPFVPDVLKRAGADPLACLPASSPVLKHGFELDARAALRMLSDHMKLFTDTPADLSGLIKPLSRLRDKWAHQQDLSHAEATRFLKASEDLCRLLSFEPEARACQQLCQHPPQGFDLKEHIDNWEPDHDTSISSFEKYLFDQAELPEMGALQTAFVWAAASDWINGTRLAPLIVLDAHSTEDPAEIGLPIRSLWWLFGLSHKAPIEIRRAAYTDWLNSLDPLASDF